MVSRINGFSGMDVDSMVKSLMSVKRVPLDKLKQQKQIFDWTRDSYRELNSKIVQMSNKLFDMSSKSELLNTQKSTVSGNSTAVKAEANADASNVSLEVKVTKLAEKAIMKSSVELQVGGTKATRATTLADLTGSATPGTYDLNINDKTVQFGSTDSIAVVIARINSEVPTVNATFDEISGKFTITHKEFGKAITDTDSNKLSKTSSLLGALKLDAPANFGTGGKVNYTEGEVTVTSGLGGTETYKPSTDSLTVNGVKLTFLEVTGATNSKITTQSDPTKAVETIKSFVDSYNELLGLMNSKISEQTYRDFKPLTDEQRESMKEDDIKKWEEKAKSGILKNDGILSDTVTTMRMIISNNLKGLSEAGITTGQYYEKGQLKIDEAKLTAALTANPDKVLSIFRGSASDLNGKPIFGEIRGKLNETLDMFTKKVGTSKFDTNASMALKTESIMGEQLKDYNNRISNLERKMTNWETRYYKQFTAMEKAMSQFQSQSSSLASYFK
ncbi:flagellar hook-associated protein 2 [Paenibacillus polysaccharolyticus]|uniref:Flagellar hook-associated protein 2 n=1 Tax=Paenibacillus polysaccharolyticus TaxID=582692 RepID=A0A1G5K7U6_9BACL|nr:flagellar filament capping protein FliD [Paenibacillus polysaccharolyticus]SCY96170.1 flagellar hook-associated protein 2 [Paenibacillus polysaccharolyticus]